MLTSLAYIVYGGSVDLVDALLTVLVLAVLVFLIVTVMRNL
jgi:hypothetical protein